MLYRLGGGWNLTVVTGQGGHAVTPTAVVSSARAESAGLLRDADAALASRGWRRRGEGPAGSHWEGDTATGYWAALEPQEKEAD
jgi:hypothetical protein